jgi:catechol 2,3-dioxygenase-like lactoylglutathione lyase family enzyme
VNAVRVSVVIDSVDPQAIAGFWCSALGHREAADLGQFVVLAPEGGEHGPVVILQRVPEERAGKNRVHLDLHPADADEHLAQLERLGAHRLGDPVTELEPTLGIRWQRMADPQGNEFCVVTDPVPDPAPAPAR